jgi:hypothetical protein
MSSRTETLRELYKHYELVQDDVFVQKLGGREIPTITRTGIEKIQGKLGIKLTYEMVHISSDQKCVTIKCTGILPNGEEAVESYGESSPDNTKQSYPVAMAEKRAKARVVLQVAGFYQQGVYSEDELK